MGHNPHWKAFDLSRHGGSSKCLSWVDFQRTTAASSAGCRVPWGRRAGSAPVAARSACGAATWSSVWTPMPTWPLSPTASVWSGIPWAAAPVSETWALGTNYCPVCGWQLLPGGGAFGLWTIQGQDWIQPSARVCPSTAWWKPSRSIVHNDTSK